VYAIGSADQLSELEGHLWRGPRLADVRGVHATEDTVDSGVRGFQTRY
jgi:hypothetical protein